MAFRIFSVYVLAIGIFRHRTLALNRISLLFLFGSCPLEDDNDDVSFFNIVLGAFTVTSVLTDSELESICWLFSKPLGLSMSIAVSIIFQKVLPVVVVTKQV